MLTSPLGLRIFVALDPLHMRKQFDGLAGAVRKELQGEPLSGHVFLFFNRRRTMVKAIYWDGSGYRRPLHRRRDLRSAPLQVSPHRAKGSISPTGDVTDHALII